MTLLKWNKDGRNKFNELIKNCETITLEHAPYRCKIDDERKLVYRMYIGGLEVFITEKFYNKLFEKNILVEK